MIIELIFSGRRIETFFSMKSFNNTITEHFRTPGILVLFVIFSALIMFSCEKNKDDQIYPSLPDTYVFSHSEFKGNIDCYDTLGNRLDYISDNFIKNDFLFSDGSIYPYEQIEMEADSTTKYFYTRKEIIYADYGSVTLFKDTLHFYFSGGTSSHLIFRGVLNGQRLEIPAYGYKFEYIWENGASYSSLNDFGTPDTTELIEDLKYSGSDRLYIQKFNLVYENTGE